MTTSWVSHGHDGDEDPAEYFRRVQAPENELPVAVPVNVLLGRTDDVAVAWTGTEVYSTGVAFTLEARARVDGLDLNDVFWHNAGAPDQLLLGIEYADGRWAVHGGGSSGPDIALHPQGGSGGDRSCSQGFWLYGVPPAGPLTLVLRCAGLGLEETRTQVDGGVLAAAVPAVVELWPWTPPRPEESVAEPAARPLPADSWFAAHPDRSRP